jgi:hypothetical protein
MTSPASIGTPANGVQRRCHGGLRDAPGVREPAIPNDLLNGSVFGNDTRLPVAHRSGILVNNRDADRRGLPLTIPRCQRRDLQLPAGRSFAGTPANLNYFFSAASCWFALLTAALTAARNGSLPAGACTLPDSVLRKETFLP